MLSGADPLTVSDDSDTVEALDPNVTDLDTPAEALVEIPTLNRVGLGVLVLVIVGAALVRPAQPDGGVSEALARFAR